MTRWRLWVPLLLFAGFVGLAGYMLTKPKDEFVESRMVGKELPYFALRPATQDRPGVASADFRSGKPRLLNIFASWCVPCAAEAPQLMALKRAGVEIDAIAIRDARPDVDRFLDRYGNPYARIGLDERSAVQIALGSSGVPESFVIDGKGRIAYQHIGDIRADDMPMILQRLKDAQ